VIKVAKKGKRVFNRLSARGVATMSAPGRHPDGGGLYLVIDKSGAKRWAFLFTLHGRSREMGLGPLSSVSLEAARRQAARWRAELGQGNDPIEVRDGEKPARAPMTFGAAADALIASKESEWRNAKHRLQWAMTLEKYAAPLRPRTVSHVDTEAVLAVLTPIWREKPETASRLRGRIEAVIDYARALGEISRNEANPARWRGHLDKLLPKRGKLTRGHHAAMDYHDVPSFVGRLREREAVAALALEFCILTATRSGEVLGAKWSEFDLERRVWTIPAMRMKAAREHRVPLSEPAHAIVEKLHEMRDGEFVFPGQRSGASLSIMAMTMVLRRMNASGVTVHGFRSAFRDRCGNETHFPREVAEAALAHVVGDKAEQAYRRSDALEKRRDLMEAWALFCETERPINVLQFGGRQGAK
jgi:integrase